MCISIDSGGLSHCVNHAATLTWNNSPHSQTPMLLGYYKYLTLWDEDDTCHINVCDFLIFSVLSLWNCFIIYPPVLT